jgi:hypothetical protein
MNFYADGETYVPALDQERLTSQLERVKLLMQDGRWRTLGELQSIAGGTEASVSARLRDLRKSRHGSHTVNRRRVAGGLFEYQLVLMDKDGQRRLF